MTLPFVPLLPVVAGPSADADALAWAAAVTAAGGTYSAGTLTALSNFFVAAKANGYNSKLYCFNPMAGNQLAACLVQRVNGSWAQATNHNFVNGDYTEATGLTGDGSTKYLDTGVPQTALTLTDRHLSVYERVRSNTTFRASIGAAGGSNSNLFAISTFAAGQTQYWSGSTSAGAPSLNSEVSGGVGGHYVGVDSGSSTAPIIYKNGGGAVTGTVLAATLQNVNVFVFADNQGGSATGWTNGTEAAYSIGSGLSPTDVANFYADLQAFQTALSRQV